MRESHSKCITILLQYVMFIRTTFEFEITNHRYVNGINNYPIDDLGGPADNDSGDLDEDVPNSISGKKNWGNIFL